MIEWDLNGFTDINGNLSTTIESSSDIWKPPMAEIGEHPDLKGNMVKCIIFPIPDEWQKKLPVHDDVKTKDLNNIGWTKQEQSDTLVDDFINIADGQDEDILNFALKWGPLWLCASHEECFWTPVPRLLTCAWSPAEPVYLYKAYAKQARAVFNAVAYLQDNKCIPAMWWEDLGWDGKIGDFLKCNNNILIHKIFVTSIINSHLKASSMSITWWKVQDKQLKEHPPKLTIETQLGFLGVLWLKIAQLLTDSKSLYICDGCGKAYIRRSRKPKKGQKNFCSECGSTAAKREWARQHKKQNNTTII